MTTEERLEHAMIAIGELLSVLHYDNWDDDHHWAHKYNEAAKLLVEHGAITYPGHSIDSHLGKVFTPETTQLGGVGCAIEHITTAD